MKKILGVVPSFQQKVPPNSPEVGLSHSSSRFSRTKRNFEQLSALFSLSKMSQSRFSTKKYSKSDPPAPRIALGDGLINDLSSEVSTSEDQGLSKFIPSSTLNPFKRSKNESVFLVNSLSSFEEKKAFIKERLDRILSCKIGDLNKYEKSMETLARSYMIQDWKIEDLEKMQIDKLSILIMAPESLNILIQAHISFSDLNQMDCSQIYYFLKYPEGLNLALVIWNIPFSLFLSLDGYRIKELLISPNDFSVLMKTFAMLDFSIERLREIDLSHLSSLLLDPGGLARIYQKGFFKAGEIHSLRSDQLNSFLAYPKGAEIVLGKFLHFSELQPLTSSQLEALFCHYEGIQEVLQYDSQFFYHMQQMSPVLIRSLLQYPSGISVLVQFCKIPITEFKNQNEKRMVVMLSYHKELLIAMEKCNISYSMIEDKDENWLSSFFSQIGNFERLVKDNLLTFELLKTLNSEQVLSILEHPKGLKIANNKGFPVLLICQKSGDWIRAFLSNQDELDDDLYTPSDFLEIIGKTTEELVEYLNNFHNVDSMKQTFLSLFNLSIQDNTDSC